MYGEAYATNSTGRFVYFKCPEGSYFGETHILSGIPMSYWICYNETIGCSALTISSEKFLKICKRYPDTFSRLRDRSENRRKLLRQYKYEIINYLINLSKRKATTSDKKDLIERMYQLLGKNKLKTDLSKYAKKRINGKFLFLNIFQEIYIPIFIISLLWRFY